MIAIEQARSGHSVLRKNGRLLGSSFDPIKEAVAWAKQAADGMRDGDVSFILGLGSGYHVLELAKLRPKHSLVVIESDSEVLEQALKINPQLKNELQSIPIAVEKDWLKLAENSIIRDHIASVYRIHLHGPSCQIDPDFFSHVEKLLLGRDKTSFLLQLKMRPEICAIVDADAISKLDQSAVSIKTIQKIFSPNSQQNFERRLWRILEELVL